MVDACASRGLKLFVGYYRRALPVFVKAKALLDAGEIGRLTAISHRHANASHRRDAGWRVNVAESGGGHFLDLASHVFDALDHITGPFRDVAGRASSMGGQVDVEDVVGVTWRTDAGVIGTSMWNFASDQHMDVIELLGTDGSLRWSSFGDGQLTLSKGKDVHTFDAPYPQHVHQPLVQTIVDELAGRGKCPSTGVTAHRTQVVMDECLSGFYGGRADAFWERPETWAGHRTR
jgi:predicted dehydrogenase